MLRHHSEKYEEKYECNYSPEAVTDSPLLPSSLLPPLLRPSTPPFWRIAAAFLLASQIPLQALLSPFSKWKLYLFSWSVAFSIWFPGSGICSTSVSKLPTSNPHLDLILLFLQMCSGHLFPHGPCLCSVAFPACVPPSPPLLIYILLIVRFGSTLLYTFCLHLLQPICPSSPKALRSINQSHTT